MNTDQQRAAFEAWLQTHCDYDDLNKSEIEIARDAYQAALASPEVQELRKDAERYRKLVADWFDNVHGREFELTNEMPPDSYESKADVDSAIDAAMGKQK